MKLQEYKLNNSNEREILDSAHDVQQPEKPNWSTIFADVDNSDNGIINKVWGDHYWDSLHATTFNYPINPNETTKQRFLWFFCLIGYVLPCNQCNNSYLRLITNRKRSDTWLTMKILASRNTLTKWLFHVRQAVNKKLGVEYLTTYEDLVNKYETYRARCYPKDFHGNQMNLDLSIMGRNINRNVSRDNGFIRPIDYKSDAYILFYAPKEMSIIPITLVTRVRLFADKNRLFPSSYYAFHDWFIGIGCNRNTLKNDPIWTLRNRTCNKIVKQMRLRSIPSHIDNLLSIVEIHLILLFCSNICQKELAFAIDKTVSLNRVCEFVTDC